MRITAGCDKCGKRFKADSVLLGKRVKCKQCGALFTVADLGEADEPAPQPHEAAGAAGPAPSFDDLFSRPPEGTPRHPSGSPADTSHGTEVPGAAKETAEPRDAQGDSAGGKSGKASPKGGLRSTWAQTVVPVAGDAEAYALAQETIIGLRRPNRPFAFPGSDWLDSLLAPVLALGSVGLIAYSVLNADDMGVAWLGALRIGLYLLAYGILVVPAVCFASRWAAAKERYQLPPNSLWRTGAAFMATVGLGCFFWYSGNSFASFLTGALLGLIVALGAMFVLHRLRTTEVRTTFAYCGAAFVLAGALAVGLIVGVNYATLGFMRQFKTASSLSMSPIGPGMDWPVPAVAPAPASPVPTAPALPQVVKPPTPPATMVVAPGTGTTQTASVAPHTGTIFNEAEPAPTTMVVVPPIVLPPTVPVLPPVPVPPVHPAPPGGGVVLAMTDPAPFGKAVEIIAPPVPNSTLLVVRRGTDQDKLEVWSGQPPALKNSVPLGHPPMVVEPYAVNPAGDLIARLTHRSPPVSLQVQAWMVAREDFAKAVELEMPEEPGILVGFNGPDTVLVRREIRNNCSLALVDVRAGKVLKTLRLPPHNFGPGTFAVSPDGKLVAVVPSSGVKPEIQLIALGSEPARRLDAAQFNNRQTATSLCFSPDSTCLTVFMEQDGEAEVAQWRPGNALPVRERHFPADPIPSTARATFKDQRLVALPDGNSWLIGGRYIIGGDSFKQLADLGIESATEQRLIGPDTVLIMRSGGDSVLVRLDLPKLTELEAASHHPTP